MYHSKSSRSPSCGNIQKSYYNTDICKVSLNVMMMFATLDSLQHSRHSQPLLDSLIPLNRSYLQLLDFQVLNGEQILNHSSIRVLQECTNQHFNSLILVWRRKYMACCSKLEVSVASIKSISILV